MKGLAKEHMSMPIDTDNSVGMARGKVDGGGQRGWGSGDNYNSVSKNKRKIF